MAVLLAAMLPGCHAQITAASFQQSTYGGWAAGAAGQTAGVAGLMWQGTPSALTPTNFTIMFPYAQTAGANTFREGPDGPAGNSRVEIHLPGLGVRGFSMARGGLTSGPPGPTRGPMGHHCQA